MVYTLPLSLDQDLAVPALCSSRIVSFEGERERERERERDSALDVMVLALGKSRLYRNKPPCYR